MLGNGRNVRAFRVVTAVKAVRLVGNFYFAKLEHVTLNVCIIVVATDRGLHSGNPELPTGLENSITRGTTGLKAVSLIRLSIRLQNYAVVWGGGSERILHGWFPIQPLR